MRSAGHLVKVGLPLRQCSLHGGYIVGPLAADLLCAGHTVNAAPAHHRQHRHDKNRHQHFN